MNGQRVFAAKQVNDDWWTRQRGRIGLGGYYKRGGERIKFRSVRIPRLMEEPRGFDGKDDAPDSARRPTDKPTKRIAPVRVDAVLPPGCEHAFMIPSDDKDQFGNPVATRDGGKADPSSRRRVG